MIGVMIISRIPDIIYGIPLTPREKRTEIPIFELEELSYTVPVILYSLNFHFLVPYISQNFCSHGDKSRRIISYSTICVALTYILLGASVGYGIKDEIPLQIASTNSWKNYGHQFNATHEYWAMTIKYAVTLFPAISMISTGPVAAVSLAESLQSLMSLDKGGTIIVTNTPESLGNQSFKLLAWILPLAVAVFVVKLGTVAGWTGIVIYYTLFINSSMLYIAAARKVPIKSPYSGWHSSIYLSILIIVVGMLAMIYNINALWNNLRF